MSSYIALIPGALATIYLCIHFLRGSGAPIARTFLVVYLPTLLLLPQEYFVDIPVLPNLNFSQSAIIPIFIAFLLFPERKQLSVKKGLRLMDFLVVSYALVCVFSEYYNTGMEEGGANFEQNLWRAVLYRNTLNVILPYFLARKLIHANGLTQTFGKILVFCSFFALVISAYEWKMVVNLYVEIFQWFFPELSEQIWVPSYRYGLVRISGPFGHPILFGTGIATALLFNHWLSRNKFWKKNLSFLFLNSYWKGACIALLLFFGLVLTFSRGPLYSSIFAVFILGLGYTRHRGLYLLGVSAFFAIITIFVIQYITYYSEIGENLASSQLEQTAIYRVNLIQAYMEYIQEKLWLGWGATTWPKALSMVSIDNEYLFILVTHGVVALVIFCAILMITSAKLFRAGMKIPYKFRFNQSLAFTLLSVLFMFTITFITVYMAHQVEVLTFIIIGLSQGFLDTEPTKQPYTVTNARREKSSLALKPT